MKQQITRISVLQSSKIMTALYVLLGFVYTFIGILMIVFGGPSMKIAGIVYCFMPVILGIFGFLGIALCAVVYNLLASKLGGVEFELTPKE
jgi:hypothetical protein